MIIVCPMHIPPDATLTNVLRASHAYNNAFKHLRRLQVRHARPRHILRAGKRLDKRMAVCQRQYNLSKAAV